MDLIVCMAVVWLLLVAARCSDAEGGTVAMALMLLLLICLVGVEEIEAGRTRRSLALASLLDEGKVLPRLSGANGKIDADWVWRQTGVAVTDGELNKIYRETVVLRATDKLDSAVKVTAAK